MPQSHGTEEGERRWQPDRRDIKSRSGWTIAKEIWGTMIGVLPFVVALVIWGARVNERITVVEMRADIADKAERRREEEASDQRREVIAKIDRLGTKIEELQQTVARLAVRADDNQRRITIQAAPDEYRRPATLEDRTFQRTNPNTR